MDKVPTKNHSKEYTKHLEKERKRVKLKRLKECLSLCTIKVFNMQIHKASPKHLNEKTVLFRHITKILMHVKESEGTIKEVILTDKQIMFKHKHTEEKDIKTAIETMNEDGKTYEQMKKGKGKARERINIQPRKTEYVHTFYCNVCKVVEGVARKLLKSSLSSHINEQHKLDYSKLVGKERAKEKALLLQLNTIILSIRETGELVD